MPLKSKTKKVKEDSKKPIKSRKQKPETKAKCKCECPYRPI